MKYIFDIPDNVDYGVLTCRTNNGYYEYNFDGADLEKLPPAHGTNLAEVGTDCISRQAAIDALTEYGNGRAVFISVGEAVIRIEQLPPAQPKRWKWVLVCDNNGMHFICNKCGAWRYHQEQKFCGECGADMREVTT